MRLFPRTKASGESVAETAASVLFLTWFRNSLLAVLLTQGCTLIVDTDDLQIECAFPRSFTGFGSDPCGDGRQCVGGVCLPVKPCTTPIVGQDPCVAEGNVLMHCDNGYCRPCAREEEVCDGMDNDCDGFIDNGYDNDGDGFTHCGGAVPTQQTRDCDDTDPNVHPPETIDGTDEVETLEVCDATDNKCRPVQIEGGWGMYCD